MEDINNNTDKSLLNTEHKIYSKNVVLVLVVLALLIIIGYFYLQLSSKTISRTAIVTSDNIINKEERAKKDLDAYYSSLLKNNPMELQNLFLEDIKNGVNDQYTKSDAYFITHRFFDNGGNIYEIYDYIESHPELAFLKEAELIYPAVFERVKNREVDLPYNLKLHAYLAYVETLVTHGYADIAGFGTVANQYAKMAFFFKSIVNEVKVSSDYYNDERSQIAIKFMQSTDSTEKALKFIALAGPDIKKILDGKLTSSDIPARDILVGLNQYAAALRYLEAAGVSASSTISSKEIFAFSMNYSYKNVQELVFFTSLLNASTLVILPGSTSNEIKNALYPILDFDVKKLDKNFNLGIIGKIIDSRFEVISKNAINVDRDVYGKRNILMLAKKVPEFKKWLMYNGWAEADFK